MPLLRLQAIRQETLGCSRQIGSALPHPALIWLPEPICSRRRRRSGSRGMDQVQTDQILSEGSLTDAGLVGEYF